MSWGRIIAEPGTFSTRPPTLRRARAEPRDKGDPMRLAGKVAIVTGGGSGIGRGIVLALAREGADVAIPDIQVLNAEKVADELKQMGRKSFAMKTDVTSSADVKGMVDRTKEVLG